MVFRALEEYDPNEGFGDQKALRYKYACVMHA
jgi:hypothetical protein